MKAEAIGFAGVSGRVFVENVFFASSDGDAGSALRTTKTSYKSRGARLGMQAAATTGVDSYAGDITPNDTWSKLQEDPAAILIDVRTKPEWSYVGTPDLNALSKSPLLISWQVYPEMTVNSHFADELRAKNIAPGQPLYFLCRSGARSRAAAIAMTAAGFGPCYNIAGGFEGDMDAQKQRGHLNGWKAAGLAWSQS
jgi:rhodanese-related sulfurtransferase